MGLASNITNFYNCQLISCWRKIYKKQIELQIPGTAVKEDNVQESDI